MMILGCILFLPTFASLLLYFYFKRSFNYWKLKGVPYKEPTFPFGNISGILRGTVHPGKYIAKLYDEFEGPYFGIYGFARPYLVLKEPELIRRILITDFRLFPNRIFYCDEKIDPIMSNSLLGIRVPQWKALRSKLSPIFTSGKIKKMMYLIKECGEDFKNHMETRLEKNVDIREVVEKYTKNVITSYAFGMHFNSFVNDIKIVRRRIFPIFFNSHLNVLAYFFAPLAVKIFKFKFFDVHVAEFWRKICMSTICQREAGNEKRHDLVDALIDLKNRETEDDEFKFYGDRLVAQAITFFLAGETTSSATIAFTLHEVCINMNIQNRLRQEIEDVIERHGDLTYEAVQDMQYLHMVVSESLRKYPLTSFIHRESIEVYVIPETGLVLERGTAIIIPQHGLHWNPKYFPNPEKYDPERFDNGNKHKIPSYVYFPFGEGPRNCIENSGPIVDAVQLVRAATPSQEQEDENEDDVIQKSNVKDFGEAINYLKHIEIFLSGMEDESECFMKTFNLRTELEKRAIDNKIKNCKQSAITDFF